jgi:hypothetical protein
MANAAQFPAFPVVIAQISSRQVSNHRTEELSGHEVIRRGERTTSFGYYESGTA